jgi:putative ABC transport system substrate-binding protein
MKRREFLCVLGGAAVWPITARAQKPALPVIGYLGSSSFGSSENQIAGFRRGLEEASWVEGKSVAIEYRWSDGQYDRLPAMAAELASLPVAVILASGLPAALAAKNSNVPMVFVMGADPVTSGLVAGLNRPSGNITGISQFYGALGGKRLEMLREIVPGASVVAVLTNPNNPNSQTHLTDVQGVARATGQKLVIAEVRAEADFDAAFASFARNNAGAILVADDPFFTVNRKRIVSLAAKFRLPAIYYTREYADDGGLITYGSSTGDNYRAGGVLVGRILKGEKPGNLPVQQPTKFELVINLRTARVLGIAVPPTMLARADEVIE